MNFPQDPYQLQQFFWPTVTLYDKEWDVIYSVERNDITTVKSCNMAGKDFIAGFICPTTMLKHNECRIVTTSVVDDHLRVLWDEIRWWVEESSFPWDRGNKGVLLAAKGGPFLFNHRDIRMRTDLGYSNKSYLKGMVSETGEKMSGHHARDMTMLVVDEASSMNDLVMTFAEGWCRKFFLFGNPNECQNRYRRLCDGGDVPDPSRPGRFNVKVLQIRAEDIPNVKLALEQIKRGQTPTNDVIVPGVMMYENGPKGYRYRREHWDPIRQRVGLDGEFWVGKGLKLIDPDWFTAANAYGQAPWDGKGGRRPPPVAPFYLGIDCAEGGDDTSWVLIDKHGVIKVVSLKTADTNVIYGRTLDFMREHKVDAGDVLFDRGGGGKQCADRLRAAGYAVRTVSFGTIKNEPQRSMRLFGQKKETIELKDEAKSRRSEMYLDLRVLLEIPLRAEDTTDPIIVDAIAGVQKEKLPVPNKARFALPLPMCEELIRELACVPLRYDELGRFDLIPKQKDKKHPDDPEDQNTFRYLIGRSPDVADAFALAVHGMEHKPVRGMAGVS